MPRGRQIGPRHVAQVNRDTLGIDLNGAVTGEIQLQLASGKDALQAVEEASISRVRPVSMAALTTILGMSPLLTDAFFQSMAVVIMFGLGFATLLTLVVLPVLYCVFYGIKAQTKAEV